MIVHWLFRLCTKNSPLGCKAFTGSAPDTGAEGVVSSTGAAVAAGVAVAEGVCVTSAGACAPLQAAIDRVNAPASRKLPAV